MNYLEKPNYNLLADLMNNPVFTDAEIHLKDPQDSRIFNKVGVSKLLLAKKSSFFDALFRRLPEEKSFILEVKEEDSKWLSGLLKFEHTNELPKEWSGSENEAMKLYQFALQFDVPDVFSNWVIQSTEELLPLYDFIEKQNGVIGVGEHRLQPQTTWKAQELFHQKAGEMVRAKFRSINDILEHKKEYIALTVAAIKEILKNPFFQTDSENSIFTILMIWINKDMKELKESERPEIREREHYLKELLPLVDLSRLSPYFLISVGSNVLDEIVSEDVKEFANERFVTALEAILTKNVINPPDVPRERASSGTSCDKFAMKVEFRRISEWKEGEKYYSQPIFSNGFLFYFFMRVEKSENNTSYLAGYLRCTCDATVKSSHHYLPVTVTFEIALQNGKTRKFPAVSVVFDHFDRSIGSRMNQPTDNWEKIKIGQSDIVKDDKIIVIIGVEFRKSLS
jgi:hypothetical protein